MADVNINQTNNNTGTDTAILQLAALVTNLSEAVGSLGENVKDQQTAFYSLTKALDQLTRTINDNSRSRRSFSGGSTSSGGPSSASAYTDPVGRIITEGLTGGFARFSSSVSKDGEQLSKSFGNVAKEAENLKRVLGGLQLTTSLSDANTAATIQNLTRLFRPGGIKAVTASATNSAATFAARSGMGVVGGTAFTLAIMGALKGLESAIMQLTAGIKENLSYDAVATRWRGTIGLESRLGNLGAQAAGGLSPAMYDRFRNQMRMLGLKDNEKILQSLLDVAGAGIGGGVGRADALSVARGIQAVRSVYGINMDARNVGELYRVTQGSDGITRDMQGNYTITRVMGAISTIAKLSASTDGAQTSMTELKSIMDGVRESWRGSKNDLAAWTLGMEKFSKAIAEGEITVSQAKNLINQPGQMSNDALMQLLALSGVQGDQLFNESYKFRQRSFSAEGQLENARQVAKMLQNSSTALFGRDPAFLDTMLRNMLPSLGLGAYTQTANIPELLDRLSKMPTEAAKKELEVQGKDYVAETAQTLSTIQTPVQQIRDILYERFARGTAIEKTLASSYASFTDFPLDAQGVAQSVSDINSRSNAALDSLGQQTNTSNNYLQQIANNTSRLLNQKSTGPTANSAVRPDEQ